MTAVLPAPAAPASQITDPTGNDLKRIPVAELSAHPNNRKRFKTEPLQQLASQLKEVGQVEPALVRPIAKGFQILSGERRWRATKIAGLPTLLCLVRELTDEQAIEVLAITMVEHQDTDPMDEAALYKEMLTFKGWTPARIAQRLGRGLTYVRDRLRLLRLVPEAQKLLTEETIELGHALVLCQLSDEHQKRLIKGGQDRYSGVTGLFREEETLFADAKRIPVSVAELRDYVKAKVKFDPRSEVVAELWPETAAAVKTADSTKQKVLWLTDEYRADDEVRKDGDEKVYGEQSWKRADGSKGAKTCEYSKLGVMVSGERQSEAFQVCVRRDKCTVHWGAEVKAAAQRAKERERAQAKEAKTNKAEVSAAAKETPAQKAEREQKEKEAAAAVEAENARWEKAQPSLWREFFAMYRKLPIKADSKLGKRFLTRVYDHGLGWLKKNFPRGTSAEDMLRYWVLCDMAEDDFYDVFEAQPDRDELIRLFKEFGLDAVKMVDRLVPKPAAKKQAAAKAPAKKKAKAKK